jgi:hypothetical protein
MRFLFVFLHLALVSAMPCILEEGDKVHVTNSSVPNGEAGPYEVKRGTIAKIPGLKGGGNTGADIIYAVPKNGEKLPLISFAHGMGGPVSSYTPNNNFVASFGFVIIAVHSCPIGLCLEFHRDQLQAIIAAKADPSLHPALASVDFSNVGIYGHSLGAMATVGNAGMQGVDPAKYNIKAAVAEHPCWNPLSDGGKGLAVPILFTAGSKDTTCADQCSERMYSRATKPQSKIFWDIEGADHNGPINSLEPPVVAAFLSCWLRNENCDKVYGSSGKEICNQLSSGTLHACLVEGGKDLRPAGSWTKMVGKGCQGFVDGAKQSLEDSESACNQNSKCHAVMCPNGATESCELRSKSAIIDFAEEDCYVSETVVV